MKNLTFNLFLVASVQLFACTLVGGSNILFFHFTATSSHRIAIWPLAEELANRGHNVTYIFPMAKRLGSHPGIEEIIPSKLAPLLAEFLDFDIKFRLNHTTEEFVMSSFSKLTEFCESFYDSPEIQEWLHKPNLHYDLMFLDAGLCECGYGLLHKFQAKHVLFFPIVIPYMFDAFGFVPESSSVPDFLFHRKPSEMTFFNRVLTTFTPYMFRFMQVESGKKIHKEIVEKLNLTSLPPLIEFERNTSLAFLNHNFIDEYPISVPPMFVSKLANFIQDSNGFVYISFGSAVVASSMPESMRDIFFKVFEAFPEIKFFWRWTGRIPENVPSNVMLHSWFPQKDIMAHPKIKGFITQAGRVGVQEALCEAVPLITIPIMIDQDYNADRFEYVKAAINLELETITPTNLGSAIREILQNPKYTERMNELSEMFKDHPVDPLENALYWIEYVLKYDTSLLKPFGMNQTWYERRLLDVYGFLLLISLLLIAVLTSIVIAFYKCAASIIFKPKRKVD